MIFLNVFSCEFCKISKNTFFKQNTSGGCFCFVTHWRSDCKKVLIVFSIYTGRKLNVHKTFRRRPGRLLNVLCTYNLRPVSVGFLLSTYTVFVTVWKSSFVSVPVSISFNFLVMLRECFFLVPAIIVSSDNI